MATTSSLRGRATAGCAALVVVLCGCGGAPDEPRSSARTSPSGTPVTTTEVPDRQPHTLVLKATGSGRIASVKYTLDHEVRKNGKVKKLPWRTSVTVPADGEPHSWRLTVKFTGTGHVDLSAIFDGQVVARGGSSGSGAGVQGTASVGGTVNG